MRRTTWFIVILFLSAMSTRMAAQIPRLINYQGQLMGSNGQPVPEGDYRITFKIYSDVDSLLWTEVHDPVFVGGGMFHAILGTITPLGIPFDEPYFLGIQVGSDPELVPKMMLTSAAYAIRAEEATKLLGITVSTTPQPYMLLPLDQGGKFPAGVLSNENGSGEFLKKDVPDTTYGTSTAPMLLASNQGTGDGINAYSKDGAGLAGRSDTDDGLTGWTGAAGSSGVFGHSTLGKGVLGRSDSTDGVTGWTGGSTSSGVFGHADLDGAYGVYGLNHSTGSYGYLGGAYGIYGEGGSEQPYAGFLRGSLKCRLPSGEISITTPGGWPGLIAISQNGHRRDIIVWDSGIRFVTSSSNSAPTEANGLSIIENGNVGIGTTNPDEALRVIGTVKCSELQITGGSDFAESFDITRTGTLQPGMVVAIDPDNPGNLRISDKAYDPKVAGVVSGAGGISAGMVMGQSGTMADGEHPVALSGRVYCLADASQCPIVPGDLLTTSNRLGHAMKASDLHRAQGAVLGKAMSSLENGQGLVLVLVTLQ